MLFKNLDFILMMYIQKIKVRCQSSQQILKNKEYFNLTG